MFIAFLDRHRVFIALGGLAALLGCRATVPYVSAPIEPKREIESASRYLEQDVFARAASREHAPARFDASDGLDEAELIAIGLTWNPELRAKRAEIGVAESLLVGAGVLPNPELTLSLRPEILGAGGLAVGLDLLFGWLKERESQAQVEVAHGHVAVARAEILSEEYRLATAVRSALLESSAAELALESLEEEAMLRARVAAQMAERVRLGEATEIESLGVEVENLATERAVRAARNESIRRRELLALAIGLPPHFELRLKRSQRLERSFRASEPTDDEIDRALVEHRLDLSALVAAHDLAEAELRLACERQAIVSSLGPSLEREVDGALSVGVVGTVELPVYQRNEHEIALRRAERDAASARYTARLTTLRNEALAARSAVTRARVELETQENEVLLRIDQLSARFDRALETRDVTVSDWLLARNRALSARRDFTSARIGYLTAVLALEAALGLTAANEEVQK